MVNHYYTPLHMCMYCGASNYVNADFTDEHIIPLSLGGNLVLEKSSCIDCAKVINREIETPVLFKEWKRMRIKRNFPSRNKGGKRYKNETHVKLRRHDGSVMRIKISDYSCPMPLYKYKKARILSGEPHIDNNLHWTMDILTDHGEEMEMKRKFPKWNQQHVILPQPYPYARLIAKIAFSYAVAEYGLAGFTPLVTDIILGESDDYFYTVGGSLEAEDAIVGGDHITAIKILFENSHQALLIVDVRLFSQIRSPSYHAVVGRIDFNNPKHAEIFNNYRAGGKIDISSAT